MVEAKASARLWPNEEAHGQQQDTREQGRNEA